MALKTRQNPETGILEVLVKNEWIRFDDYRREQIGSAYLNSIRFLRERLGEEISEENTSASKVDE